MPERSQTDRDYGFLGDHQGLGTRTRVEQGAEWPTHHYDTVLTGGGVARRQGGGGRWEVVTALESRSLERTRVLAMTGAAREDT
jgi:hypothetical protein